MKKQAFRGLAFGLVAVGLLTSGVLVYSHYRADTEAANQRLSRGGKVIDTACGPIEYTEFGEGAPALIVHGAGGGYDQGEYIARKLGGDFRWIAPSRFGYLKTPLPPGASAQKQAEAYACLLDSLGIERVAVLGYSAGGPSALQFALRYPERTTALVMASALSHPPEADPSPYAKVRGLVLQGFLNDFVYWAMVHTGKDTLRSMLGFPASDMRGLPPEQQAQAEAFLDDMMPMGARRSGLIFDMTHLADYSADWPDQLQRIRVPTLVVHARNDTLALFEQGEFTAQHIPQAQFIARDKGGHGTAVFFPETMAEVAGFLNRYGSGAAVHPPRVP